MIKKQLMTLFALLTCILLAGQALATTERYDYDPLGRLIRAVEGNNKSTEYIYDAAGNILEVRRSDVVAAPAITSITPSSLRRGETKAITLTGTGFVGASLSTPAGSGLSVKNLQTSATQIKFDLTATDTATIGSQALSVASSAGSATSPITVAPLLPKVNVDPTPLAIPPDSATRQFTIRLSHVDAIDHVIGLSASNNRIEISPATITIPAGQLSVSANIKGVSVGQVSMTLVSNTLGSTTVPVFVTAEFRGITTSFAPGLGIVVETPPQQKTQQITPVTNPLVGVILGSAIRHTSPNRVNVGTENTLSIHGNGLSGAQSATIEPNTGVTLGTPVASTDGFTVQVPITVASDAPVTQRRLTLRNAAGAAYPAAHPSADRVEIVRPAPELHSIEPLFGVANSTIEITIRGRNLHNAEGILFNPSAGIATDAMPVVSSDGTILTAKVNLRFNAEAGEYKVSVATPGGLSSTTANSTNTFTIVDEIKHPVTPIVAHAVGVLVETTSTPVTNSYGLASPIVSVVRGSAIKAVTPAVGIVGQEVMLTLEGSELPANTQLYFEPNTGITVMRDDIAVASDGTSMTVPIVIESDAPLTPRRLMVADGERVIPFANAESSVFKVSLPIPEIDYITPILLQTGQAPVALHIHGRNFKDASAVKITPADGMTISAPPAVNDSGTQVTVNISAASNAAIGPRLVTVTTPAGESTTTLRASNTLSLANSAGTTYSPIVSSLLGIVKQTPPVAVEPMPVGPVIAPLLGIVKEDDSLPASVPTTQYANTVGITVGSVALDMSANGFVPGFNGALTIQGHELNGVTSVDVRPADGITLGTPTVAPNGSQVSVPMTVATSAPRGIRTITLNTASGAIRFTDPTKATLQVGPGVPHIDSISPILAEQGDTVNMVIRGARLHDAMAVTASPSAGIRFEPTTLSVNAAGTELSVSFTVNADAPIGSRVIQVLVPGAESSATASAANTFTVFAKPK